MKLIRKFIIIFIFFPFSLNAQIIKTEHISYSIREPGETTWSSWKDGVQPITFNINENKITVGILNFRIVKYYGVVPSEFKGAKMHKWNVIEIGTPNEYTIYVKILDGGKNLLYIIENSDQVIDICAGFNFTGFTNALNTSSKTDNTPSYIVYSINKLHSILQCHYCKKQYTMELPSRIVETSNSEGKSALIEAAYFYSNQVDNTNMINSKCLALSNESDKHEFLEIKKWNTILQKKEHNESYDEVMKSYESLGAIEKSIFVNCMKASTAALAAGKISGID
ncbi:MAG: hypothetical protein H6587_13160 [Flavobacteriales bacterium]|nr:hypothetical protein [Flavobacteriales bacterium]MCB9365515.1 hypothetical protein [Flavobacteriales bacterium]